MKNWLVLILSIMVLGGCATANFNETYLNANYGGYFKAKANSEIYLPRDTNLVGFSETSQEEANQIALEACKKWEGFPYQIANQPENCFLAYEGNKRVWKESLEKHRQKLWEEGLLAAVKRCITYGFEGRVEIATCVQKEMNPPYPPSVSVVTDSTNNQEIASRLQSLEIQNAITQGMLWYQTLKPKN